MDDLNFNFAECVKEVQNIGETAYTNICNGATTVVPWGTVNYIEFGFGVGFGLLFVAAFAAVAYMIFSSR